IEYRTVTWHDGLIQPGDDWDERIHRAMARANIVVLLVSVYSLGTPYIMRTELPNILERQANDTDFLLLSILVTEVSPELLEKLMKIAFVGELSKPLERMSKKDRRHVYSILQSRIAARLKSRRCGPCPPPQSPPPDRINHPFRTPESPGPPDRAHVVRS